MLYRALATDYDGTVAQGTIAPETIDALERFRAAGGILILVTGRNLNNIIQTLERPTLFDRIVAEDGAMLYRPVTGGAFHLAPPPPEELLTALSAGGFIDTTGHVVIGTLATNCEAVEEIIRTLGLTHHLTYNKEWAMILPEGVDKAHGLEMALKEFDVAPSETIAIGDAENDIPMLRLAGLGVAVANALPHVKQEADQVTDSEAGAGVAELIDYLLSTSANRAGVR